jgi:hypothetical protein
MEKNPRKRGSGDEYLAVETIRETIRRKINDLRPAIAPDHHDD